MVFSSIADLREKAFSRSRSAGYNTDNLVYRADAPDWWMERGNVALSLPGESLPEIARPLNPNDMPTNCIVVIYSGGEFVVTPCGDGAEVIIGPSCKFSWAHLRCHGGKILIGRGCEFHTGFEMDLPRGGSASVGEFCFVETRVTISTVDAIPIINRSVSTPIKNGSKIISVGDRVWLGMESVVGGGAIIGCDTIIAPRSIVTDELPPNSVCEGGPARPIKSGVVWKRET